MLHQIYPAINYITIYLLHSQAAINNDNVTIDIYINDTHKQYTYTLMPQKVNAFIITDYIQFKDKVTSFKVNYTSTTQITAISMHSVHGNIPRDIMYIMFM